MKRREEIYMLRRTLGEQIKIWGTFESIAIAIDDNERCVLMESQIARLSTEDRLETFIAFFNAHAAMGRGLLFATEAIADADAFILIAACDRLGADYAAWQIKHNDERKECTLYDDVFDLPTTFKLPFFDDLRWPRVQA